MVIAIQGYRRPDYLNQCLDSLQKLDGIVKYPIVITIDGGPASCHDDMAEVINKYRNTLTIESVDFLDKNYGCAGAARKSFEQAFAFEGDYADCVIRIEEDVIAGNDMLDFFDYCHKNYGDNPEIFAYCSFCRGVWSQKFKDHNIDELFIHPNYETGGALAIPRRIWDDIVSLGGIFGAEGRTNVNGLSPKDWKNQIHVSDRGSYGYPMNNYFRRGRKCVYPKSSRSQNIGSSKGQWNSNEEWHEKYIRDPFFIDILSPGCKGVSFKEVK